MQVIVADGVSSNMWGLRYLPRFRDTICPETPSSSFARLSYHLSRAAHAPSGPSTRSPSLERPEKKNWFTGLLLKFQLLALRARKVSDPSWLPGVIRLCPNSFYDNLLLTFPRCHVQRSIIGAIS
ncbi:hypothetical protein PM082_008215 [Marasmius tenuissimus]|nr:hypothetical protein PM082_008215 [Marasmius tenuissimus]